MNVELNDQILEWADQDMELEDGKYTPADICPVHLKLQETFCLDDKLFTCWMCHNFNYSGDHQGHNVVPLNKAYESLKLECDCNVSLIKTIDDLV
jgi:hypothetical protein